MRPLLFTALIATTLLLGAAFPWEQGPDPVIYPKQSIPLVFDHAYHTRTASAALGIDGEGLSCTFCHENISSSKAPSDHHIPGHDVCETCHDEWIGDPEGEDPLPLTECVHCHRDLAPTTTSTLAAPMIVPDARIHFSHALHVSAEVDCVACHRNVREKAIATRDDLPTMDTCLGCHEDREASTKCTTCHFETPRGQIETTYSDGELKPRRFHAFAIHDGDFLRDHAVPAQRDPNYCASCHGQDFCLSCHDGLGRNARYHPGDWLATHSIRSRHDDNRCTSCHELQTFCLGCHVRTGVATVGPLDNPTARRTIRQQDGVAVGPHPMAANGWLDRSSRNFHGFHAQRNIRACVSCHQEQFCITCHTSSFSGPSVGGNPHGPNPERLRGSSAARHNARVCLKCHSVSDPSWR
ncbi:MAG: hypothetical protein H6729_17665 [Deltaproteobacteria bacterium]|nr:hypothetical protein [Deltaproteobacteria bacterium]